MSQAIPNRTIKILIVDDDQTSLLLMRAALRKAGYEATMATSGAQALALFANGSFDLIMLDVSMPEMSGFEVCVAMRQQGDQSLPIVMVTGLDDVASVETAYQSGATDFISKPFNWALIGHRVRYLLRGHQGVMDLRSANARNGAILKAIPDSLFEVDINGQFLSVPSSRADLLAQAPEELVGKSLTDAFPEGVARICMAALGEAQTATLSIGRQFELERQGANRWFELSVARKETPDLALPQFVVMARDITKRKADEQKILRLAMFDNLTGLPNRQSFLDRIEREIRRAQYASTRFGVLFMDLDGFKNINDTMGHSAGDLALQWAAGRLREGVRPTDLVSRMQDSPTEPEIARLGGDEFTALIVDIDKPDDIDQIAERILKLMRSPFTLLGREVRLSTSIGIAIYKEDGEDSATLLRNADTAMYHAKNAGRNNYKFYNRNLTDQAMERVSLERDLREALETKAFVLHYQPLVDLASRKVTGVETLIRWTRPGYGPMSPDSFIGAAERCGLIVDIGDWVLHKACLDGARWRAMGMDLRVAVNISSVQFKDRQLVNRVHSALTSAGLPAQHLEIELTESAVMLDTATTSATLQALQTSGVRIALDDFGTGYSSLSYLKRMPLVRLKIDQSFVAGLPEDSENLAIVKAIVAMAHSLGLSVTAEGVETPAQSCVLEEIGCQTLQGYLYGKPMPSDELEGWLLKHQHLPAQT